MSENIDTSDSKVAVRISPSILFYALAVMGGLYFTYMVRGILVQVFLALIIMVGLNPAVNVLHKRLRLPRALSAFVVYIIMLVSLIGTFALIMPPLVRELYQLLKIVNIPIPVLQDQINNLNFTVSELSDLAQRVGTSFNFILSVVTATFSSVFTFFTVLVISFYLLLDRPRLYKKLSWFTHKEEHLALAREFIDELETQLGGWVRGQLVLMILIGLVTYAGLLAIRVPYALPLAILAGMLEVLPNLGPTLASVPAIALAFFTLGPVGGAITLAFYVVVQQLENNLIVPKIMKDNADVNPLIAILVILVGLKLYGVMGALLAVPTYILIRLVYSLYYRHFLAHRS